MENTNSHSHLTLEERRIIQTGIINGSTKTAIARTIGKDNSTIGKEIKAHRVLTSKCNLPLECSNYRHCKLGRECTLQCPKYEPFHCGRRDRSPGACNGCSNRNRCRFDKYDYNPDKANNDYKNTLIDARLGVNMTVSEAKSMAIVILPLLKQGLSPYQIIQMCPELGICEKTLYNYIENDVFHQIAGITVMDLRRQVSRKPPKQKSPSFKKRQDRKFLDGRLFKDYKTYMEDHPDVFVTQMDTVYNDGSNGPFIQTFQFMNCSLLFAILHKEKTAATMVCGINTLQEILGTALFATYAHVLLTDRGTEFSDASQMETSSDGSRRTRVFYCDPMQSGQKGSLENKHVELRYILPKQVDLFNLGLTNQDALNLVLSHINSAPVQHLGGKSPLELAEFLYPDLFNQLIRFGLQKINKHQIILKPYLLKHFKR